MKSINKVREHCYLKVKIVKIDGFRSNPNVNADEDMERVVLDMPKHVWRKLRIFLNNEGVVR